MNNYILTDDSPALEYKPKNAPGKKMFAHHIKNGQQKLYLMETLFLKKYGHLSNIVVYAGASPGHHLNRLIKEWPRHTFVLYDPVVIRVKPTCNVFIINKPFTAAYASIYTGRGVLFISDIRSLEQRDGLRTEITKANKTIKQDNNLQKELIEIMLPSRSMLKFRLPWELGTTYYLSGDLYFQPWRGEWSPELRLMTDGKTYKTYCNTKIDNQMYYHNLKTRGDDVYYDQKYENDIITYQRTP